MTPCVVWIAGGAADLASSEYALRGPSGPYEANPLWQGTPARVASQTAFAGMGCIADRALRARGKRGLARWLRIGIFAAKMAVTIHNLKERR